mmetsp:Transcript_31531/g.86856  ORF Transcript_31531/g.86856 Transcript_31531/m.86856 type:complete len:270 (+) Transcript_31531:828-1637(+)
MLIDGPTSADEKPDPVEADALLDLRKHYAIPNRMPEAPNLQANTFGSVTTLEKCLSQAAHFFDARAEPSPDQAQEPRHRWEYGGPQKLYVLPNAIRLTLVEANRGAMVYQRKVDQSLRNMGQGQKGQVHVSCTHLHRWPRAESSEGGDTIAVGEERGLGLPCCPGGAAKSQDVPRVRRAMPERLCRTLAFDLLHRQTPYTEGRCIAANVVAKRIHLHDALEGGAPWLARENAASGFGRTHDCPQGRLIDNVRDAVLPRHVIHWHRDYGL